MYEVLNTEGLLPNGQRRSSKVNVSRSLVNIHVGMLENLFSFMRTYIYHPVYLVGSGMFFKLVQLSQFHFHEKKSIKMNYR